MNFSPSSFYSTLFGTHAWTFFTCLPLPIRCWPNVCHPYLLVLRQTALLPKSGQSAALNPFTSLSRKMAPSSLQIHPNFSMGTTTCDKKSTREKMGRPAERRKGPFTNDVRKILGFFDPLPPPCPHFTQPISTLRPQNVEISQPPPPQCGRHM